MKQTYKPGSVFRLHGLLSFICDYVHTQPESAYPLRRTSRTKCKDEPPLTPTYLAFQPTGFTRTLHHCNGRELLPHVFTLTTSYPMAV